MPMAQAQDRFVSSIAAEDQLRADVYRLLARVLTAAPAAVDLREFAALSGGPTAFGKAIATFAEIAAATDATTSATEYQDLFIGLGRGEVVPYGSYYLTGFLQEKPLARLRQDMARLGIGRREYVSEPEDHISCVLDIMAGLIDGAYGAPCDLAGQLRFYKAHLGSWAGIFFRDLERSQSSALYAAIGAVGRTFLDIEDKAFAMA